MVVGGEMAATEDARMAKVTHIDGDQLAARIMLGNGTPAQKQAALTAAAKAFAHHVNGECDCPNCGSGPDVHEDNGLSPTAYTYTVLCTGCGHQWSPNEG